eukprot:g20631.t1
MLEVLGLGAAAAAATGVSALSGIFSYNHGNWSCESQNRQNMLHQIQNMRYAGLYREDLKDMFGAVDTKMDNLVIVTSILISAVLGLLLSDLNIDAPVWTVMWFGIHVTSTLLYLSMSLYFAVYASIAAVASMVRVVTQEVRLPVATADDVKYACVYASDFEAPSNLHEILR